MIDDLPSLTSVTRGDPDGPLLVVLHGRGEDEQRSLRISERFIVWRIVRRIVYATGVGAPFESEFTGQTPCLAASVATMRTRSIKVACVALTLFIFVCVVRGQEAVETIRIESDLVDLKVSVLGLAPNNPAPLLESKDFVVLEDGVPQTIDLAVPDQIPATYTLLVDASQSMTRRMDFVRDAAIVDMQSPARAMSDDYRTIRQLCCVQGGTVATV